MEAVTSVLGGGLCVEVLLQGKKVRDDNRMLLQTGISCKDNLASLGFKLEPSIVQTPPPLCSSDFHPLLSCDSSQLLTRLFKLSFAKHCQSWHLHDLVICYYFKA